MRDDNANAICAQLLLLAAEDPGQGHLALHQLTRWLRDGRYGHLRSREQSGLAIADYRSTPGTEPVSGAWLRRLATGATLLTGIVLAVVVINSGWMNTWTHVVGR